MLTAGLRF